MNYLQEREIRDAVKSGDGKALEEAVNNIPRHSREFDDILRIVEDTNRHYIKRGIIEVDDTIIRDVFGKAETERN